MIHARAEAARNTRNAVARMPKILVIGTSLLDRSFEALSRHGEASKFKSLGSVHVRADDQVVLLIVDKDQHREPTFKDFVRTFADVPKIIISHDDSFRGFARWLRLPLTYPVHNPGEKELVFLADRLVAERDVQSENRKLRNDLFTSQRELEFFDAVGRVLTSDMELDNMLVVIMKRTRDMISASSWSIYLLDEETGDFVLEKTDGRKKKDKALKLRLKPGEGITGWVIQEGIPLIVPDVLPRCTVCRLSPQPSKGDITHLCPD